MDNMDSDVELDDDEETGLTHPERQKRQKRKELHTRLDQRISTGGNDGEKTETKVGFFASDMVRDVLINSLLIGLWYTFSISISVYNKWMFSSENLDFHFPLFTTSVHMLMQFLLSSLTLYLFPRFRPSRAVDDGAGQYTALNANEDSQPPASLDTATPSKSAKAPLMTRWFYLTRIGPCGTATALDIGLGNFSLRFISLTFFTMCKSSTLAFVLLFAFLFKLEQPTWRLCAVILLMTVGVLMMVAGEAAFDALGFVLVMLACLCSGFRWSVTQILLRRNPATSNPFSTLFFLTPIMFVALLILAFPIEGVSALAEGYRTLTATHGPIFGAVIMLFPGILAFLMVSAEFSLIQRTSVVTLSVCGIFKEVLTVSAASVTFGDKLSPINLSGLLVTILAIAAYNWLKYAKMRSDAKATGRGVLQVNQETSSGSVIDEGSMRVTHSQSDDINDMANTSGRIQDSLSLSTRDGDGITTGHVHGVLGNGYVSSPVKRSED